MFRQLSAKRGCCTSLVQQPLFLLFPGALFQFPLLFLQLMREAGSPWKVSVAVDPKLIGATNVRLIANKIAGEPTPATYDFKAAAIPQALLAAQPGAVNVASLGKIIPGWGQTEDFIAPWFATLEAKNK